MESQPPPRNLTPAKLDAIHRSVLAGLLGNIGVRGEAHEYTGARNIKFFLFPGSGLFDRKPQWVVAGEIVETRKLYARTIAAVKPEWAERLAPHLVARSYSEPHWQAKTAHVAAYEKVTLYGLPIVPRRLVHYGPIDPRISREMFIRHALVLGEYHSNAPFFRHNADLVAQVQALEAKARRADLLVDEDARFAFYDERVPPGIYNGPLFDKWRNEAERRDPRLLFMRTRDLLRRPAEGITEDRFPDALEDRGLRLRLHYALRPGEEDDGVTATVPLAALNGASADRLTWLVPGMLAEKIEDMIRALPKSLRTAFVPVPDVARDAAATLRPGDGPLAQALAAYLGKRSGLPIPASDLAAAELPDHLKMNVRVVDAEGRTVAMGRDLDALRRKLGTQAKQSFAELPQGEYHRDGLRSWDFGDLPPRVEVRRHGLTLSGYPALVDRKTSVSLRLLDAPEAAEAAHVAGLKRLFMLRFQGELKYLAGTVPGIDKLCLYYKPLGSCQEFKADFSVAIADRVFVEGKPGIRTKTAFDAACDDAWKKMSRTSNELAATLVDVLTRFHELSLLLDKTYPPLLQPAVNDVRSQVAALVYKGFVLHTPLAWMAQLPRFLNAAQVRLKKLQNAGLAKDATAMAELVPLLRQYVDRARKHRADGVVDPQLDAYRWMLEELRVQLFAQELKTSLPVSAKRLEQLWEKVKP